MKIFIGACLSKKNSKFLNKFLNSLTKLEVPNNYSQKNNIYNRKKNQFFKK